MSTYYVVRNLNHDCKEYKRGDTIDLVDLAAPALIEMGVVQVQPIGEEAPAPAAPAAAPESATAAAAGGQATKTGEPSLDAPQGDSEGEDQAKDVTPKTVDSEEAPAPAAPAAPAAARAPARTAARKGRKADKEPENDPSANL